MVRLQSDNLTLEKIKMEDFEEERIIGSLALLVIFITITLAILIYYDII